ncbi:MAG TPA: hypothetical protein VMV18_01125 [bacterium]|nr:hypothetical protein [bacterium]
MRTNSFRIFLAEVLLLSCVVPGLGCAKHAPGPSAANAQAIVGDWSVWQNDTRAVSWHVRLSLRGTTVEGVKVYDQDEPVTRHLKGSTEPLCSFFLSDRGDITGHTPDNAVLIGTLHGDKQGISLTSAKGNFELRRMTP